MAKESTKAPAKKKRKKKLNPAFVANMIKPGEVRNPSGRPKQVRELAIKCRDMTADVLGTLHEILLNKKETGGNRIRAGELILAYGYGKPQQTVTLDDQTERKQVSITLKVDGNEETITAEGDKLLT